MTVFLRTWLRLPLLPTFGLTANTPCVCASHNGDKTAARVTETHILHCRNDGAWVREHEAVGDVFNAIAASIGNLSYDREPMVGIANKTRYDFSIILENQRQWACDITIKSVHAKDLQAQAAKTPLVVAEAAANAKRSKYLPTLPPNTTFQPLVFEAEGAMHPDVPAFLSKMLRATGGVPPPDATFAAPTATAYWLQCLSVARVKGTAASTIAVLQALAEQAEGRGRRHRLGANATALPAALL
jgi:hypothetical protein